MLLPLLSTLFPYTTLFRSHAVSLVAWRIYRRPLQPAPRRDRHADGLDGACVCAGGAHADRSDSRLARCVGSGRSEEHTSELQSHSDLVCRLLLEKKKKKRI